MAADGHRIQTSPVKNSSPLTIGTSEPSGSGNKYFNGKMDDIQIYNYLPERYTDSVLVDIASENPAQLKSYQIQQNYPNPFNPTTTIRFSLPQTVKVKLIVYDVLGRHVATLVNSRRQAGQHSVIFNADNLPSGVYIYRLKADGFSKSKKMLLVK